jgi:sugar phosphate isomerase/epimerase
MKSFYALCAALLLLAGVALTTPSAQAAPELGLQAFTFRKLTLMETIEQASALGIHYLQAYPGQKIGGDIPGKFAVTTPQADLEKILAFAKSKQVVIASFGVTSAGKLEDWEKLFAFAKTAGIKEIVTEAPRAVLLTLAPLAKNYKINVSLHNHPKPNIYESPELALAALEGLDSRFGVAADTGHWARSGLDPVAGLKLVEKRLHSLHLKDIAERGKRSRELPYGTGTSDLAGQLTELRASGFDGIAYIEYEHESGDLVAEVARCVAYFKAAMNAPKKDLAAGQVAPPGFATDVRQVYAEGRGKDSARWPVAQPLLATDLSNAEIKAGAWTFNAEGILRPTRDPAAPAGGDLWTKESYGNFVLNLEFRTQEKTNSGVFIRTSDIVNWLHNSIEVQILQGNAGRAHVVGSLFDVSAPKRQVTITPGQWYHYTIVAKDNWITVTINGEEVNKTDLNQWTQAGLNPDSTKNKFNKAYKDMAREGRIGLQDHGGSVIEFRNLFIERL